MAVYVVETRPYNDTQQRNKCPNQASLVINTILIFSRHTNKAKQNPELETSQFHIPLKTNSSHTHYEQQATHPRSIETKLVALPKINKKNPTHQNPNEQRT